MKKVSDSRACLRPTWRGIFQKYLWVVSLAICGITVIAANAGTKEWEGFGDDSNWTTNGNWKGLIGAGRGDDLVFHRWVYYINGPHNTLRLSNTNDFPVNTSFGSLTFLDGNYRIRGNQIFLEHGLRFGTDIGDSSDPSCLFDPNIVLANSQIWDGHFGKLTMNGVINLADRGLFIDGFGDLILNGSIIGLGTIIKNDSGKLTLNGDADGFGLTKLLGGVIEVNGLLGDILIIDGVLQGSGSVKAINATCTQCDGVSIAPGAGGNTSALLRSTGPVQLNSLVKLEIDLNGPIAGTQHDQIRVTGNDVSLNGTDLDVSLGFVPTPGQQFVIISQLGAGNILGQFEQGTSFIKDGQLFFITYFGNAVVLTAQGSIGP